MEGLSLTRDLLVETARGWIGTPFEWQASVRGRGCDCKGFVWGVARELDLPEAKVLEVAIANYRRNFTSDLLLSGLEAALRRVKDPLPGDVLAIEIGKPRRPRHLAILTTDGRMVHCYGAGPQRVVEVPVGRSRPIHSFWTWPSLGAPDGH